MTTDIERSPVRPSGFSEYDNLSGYVTKTYTVEWIDQTGNHWRKTCQVINLGKPDRGIPFDPDAMIDTPEPWGEPLPTVTRGRPVGSLESDSETEKAVIAFLTENGPKVMHGIAECLGLNYRNLCYHISRRSDTVYCECGKVGKAILWGVKGVHDAT